MRKYLVTMGGYEQGENRHNNLGIHRDYTAEAMRLFESASPYLFDCRLYDNDWIKNSEYYEPHKRVLSEPSFGWMFKPLCIYDVMKDCDDGDVVIWCDSNHIFISDPEPIIKIARMHQIFTHGHVQYYLNNQWTHKDMFVRMGCDELRYWKSHHVQVNILAFLVNDFTRMFVKEWFDYAGDYETMIENKMENLPGFSEHRHEQSIFSILIKKYDVPYCDDPTDIIRELNGINKK
jgi:hypothetical protein